LLIYFVFVNLGFIFTEVLLNALDIIGDTSQQHHHHEHEPNRARSASSSPRTSPRSQRAAESNVKPTCLYVSNWTDDEKYRCSKNRIRFNETQLAERLISKTNFLSLHDIFII
jgi:hypothetical protein